MKNGIICLIFILNLKAFSQCNVNLGLSVSNFGQIEDPISNFYNLEIPNGFNLEKFINNNNSTQLKYNLNLTSKLKDSLSLRFRLGLGIHKAYREIDYPNFFTKINEHQTYLELCPSIGKSQEIGDFTLIAGLEIPLYLASSYSYLNVTDIRDSTLQTISRQESLQKIDGGFLIGFNNFIQLEMNISKELKIFSELNFGLFYAQLGGYYSEYITLTSFEPSFNSFKKSYSRLFFTAPQIQFGISLNLN